MRCTKISKKAIMWSTLGRILIVLATIVILLMVIYKISGKSFDIIDKIKLLLGFGG